MATTGWIKAERKIWHDPIFREKRWDRRSAYLYLRALMPYNGANRGRIQVRLRELAAKWGWSHTQVRIYLTALGEKGYIELHTSNRGTFVAHPSKADFPETCTPNTPQQQQNPELPFQETFQKSAPSAPQVIDFAAFLPDQENASRRVKNYTPRISPPTVPLVLRGDEIPDGTWEAKGGGRTIMRFYSAPSRDVLSRMLQAGVVSRMTECGYEWNVPSGAVPHGWGMDYAKLAPEACRRFFMRIVGERIILQSDAPVSGLWAAKLRQLGMSAEMGTRRVWSGQARVLFDYLGARDDADEESGEVANETDSPPPPRTMALVHERWAMRRVRAALDAAPEESRAYIRRLRVQLCKEVARVGLASRDTMERIRELPCAGDELCDDPPLERREPEQPQLWLDLAAKRQFRQPAEAAKAATIAALDRASVVHRDGELHVEAEDELDALLCRAYAAHAAPQLPIQFRWRSA